MAPFLPRAEILQTASLISAFLGVAALLLQADAPLRRGFPLALDFWLAAGLLRLSAEADWPAIATAGAIVCLRRLVGTALASARRA